MPYVIKSKIGTEAYFKGISNDRFKSLEYCYNIEEAQQFSDIKEAQKRWNKHYVLRVQTRIVPINQ